MFQSAAVDHYFIVDCTVQLGCTAVLGRTENKPDCLCVLHCGLLCRLLTCTSRSMSWIPCPDWSVVPSVPLAGCETAYYSNNTRQTCAKYPPTAGRSVPETEAVGEAAVEGPLPVLARHRVRRHRLHGLCGRLVQVSKVCLKPKAQQRHKGVLSSCLSIHMYTFPRPGGGDVVGNTHDPELYRSGAAILELDIEQMCAVPG